MMDCSSEEGLRSITLFDSIIKNLYRIEEHAPKVYQCPHINIRKIFGRIDELSTEMADFNVGKEKKGR